MDGFLLDGDSIQQLRADHDLLASMVQSPNRRRIVLYPSTSGGRGSGGAQIIRFKLVTVDCDAGTATAEVLNVQCDGITGLAIGDTVDIVDDDGCWLIGNPQLLEGLTGKAVKMEGGPYGCTFDILSLPCLGRNC